MTYAGISSQFSEGDAIGVYAVDGSTLRASNVKFTLSSGVWVAESKVPYNPYYIYYAYYPYSDNPYSLSLPAADLDGVFAAFISDSENRFWSADQSSKAAFDAANLMVASASADGNKNVAFTMLHKRGLAVIDGVGNTFAYASDPSTTYPVSLEFNGNIPYAMDGQYYFLMKPGQSTNFAGLSYNPASGRYSMNVGGIFSNNYSVEYSVSTDDGATWGEFSSSKPSWITLSNSAADKQPAKFLVDMTNEKTTDVKVVNTSDFRDSNHNQILQSNDLNDYATPSTRALEKPDEYVDLSMYNTNGSYRGTRTTANCYLIHSTHKNNEVIQYRIPLVYGNAIKNGSTNELAYKATATGDNIKPVLVNHLDNEITDPWIKNNGITVDGAEVVWQDVKDMVGGVVISGDYLCFQFNLNRTNFKEGNAVIAATSGGTIVWTWHIWVTPETLEDCTTINTGSHTYQVAPVNLGWVNLKNYYYAYKGSKCRVKVTHANVTVKFEVQQPDCPTDIASPFGTGYCPYYQWGRSVAEPPSDGTGNTAHTVWDSSGNIVELEFVDRAGSSGGANRSINSETSIGEAIQNPLSHFRNSSLGPYNEAYYNYWDLNNNTRANVTTATNKTIYDPCPPGFCVPTGNLYEHMGVDNNHPRGDSNWDSTLKGKTWTLNGENIFFPAAGFRYNSSVSLRNVGTGGYVWSASPSSSSNGRSLYFDSSYWDWISVYRSSGFAVRPVQEE